MPTADVFEFYKATPLPSRVVPFVVIAHQVHPSGGGSSERHRVQFFILLPGAEVIAQELDVDHYALGSADLTGEMPVQSLKRAALLRVQLRLEELVRAHIGATNVGSHVAFPPVVLTQGDEHDLRAFVLAPEYADGWEYIRTHTYSKALRTRMEKCKALRQMGFAFGNVALNPA